MSIPYAAIWYHRFTTCKHPLCNGNDPLCNGNGHHADCLNINQWLSRGCDQLYGENSGLYDADYRSNVEIYGEPDRIFADKGAWEARVQTHGIPYQRSTPSRPLTFSYEVTGSGAFPTDMLRYDQCYPDDTNSANNMLDEKRSRTCIMRSLKRPTVGRWNSFMWGVGPHRP